MDSSTDLVLWQGPTLQDFETVDIPEELLWTPPALSTSRDTRMLDGVPYTLQDVEATAMPEESLWALPELPASNGIEMLEYDLLPVLEQPVSKSQVNRSRNRPYTDAEWTQIRPVFTQLYIGRDMMLRDVIQNLKEHYGFHPSEQMCKKRIHAWGLSKNIKAAEKEDALQKLSQGFSPTTVYQKIRHDKLVRYRKSRSKQDPRGARPTKIMKQTRSAAMISCSGLVDLRKPSFDPKPVRSLAMPDHLANTDLFLRACKILMLTQDAKTYVQRSDSYTQIRNRIIDGVTFWISHAFKAASLRFSQAAELVLWDLQNDMALDIRILDCLLPEKWDSQCHLMIRKFAHFVSRVTAEYLGQQHPMTLVAHHLQEKSADKDERLKMWDCIVDKFDPTQPIEEWWDLVQSRYKYCRGAGMYDLATQYCREAESRLRESKQLTIELELDVLLDLGQTFFQQGEGGEAEEYFKRLLEIAQLHVEVYWAETSMALSFLATIYEDRAEVSQAQEYLEKALKLALQSGGIGDAFTVEYYRGLLCFYQRNGVLDEIVRSKEQFAELHNHVEEITEGLWSVELDDDPAEVEPKDDLTQTDHNFTGY